jgi:hypothetical protein
MTRRSNHIWRVLCGAVILAAAIPIVGHALENDGMGAATEKPKIIRKAESGQVVLTNGRLELIVDTVKGLNARSLRDVRTGQVYADRDYIWEGVVQTGEFPKVEKAPVVVHQPDGTCFVSFRGKLGSIEVEQRFTAPGQEPGVIVEQITIHNPTDKPVDTAAFKCGFGKLVREGDTWTGDADGIRLCPVPYRRETSGEMREFPLRHVVEQGTTYAGWVEAPQPTPIWGAEGWVWTKGAATLLIAKYNSDSMEWSLLDPTTRGAETVVKFGGAGQWKHGHPEFSTRLAPGKSYAFGETWFQAIEGDWKQAYYAYRRYTESKGCTTPQGYSPPVHWNELYDTEYYFKVVAAIGNEKNWFTPEHTATLDAENKNLLSQYYSLDLMLAEAAKAKELGCEALYLDPGWDDGLNTHVWDAARLGSLDGFVRRMREEYGLKVSVWTALCGVPPTYGDPRSCPPEARLVEKDGKPGNTLCFASPAFLDTKEKRMLELARGGIAFMMLDSDQYSGPCYSKTHGHQIPLSREDHARAILELARRVKRQYPNLLYELHDPVSGPSGNHYTPTYYGYAQKPSFDCLWGHEFMWNSMDDLISRRAVSLYYYNLAYSIPLYLHVSLKPDNENAIVFWWFASTCRHLGMGGKSANPAVWEAHKKAMQTYLPLKRFYTQGAFYGLDEMVIVHTLADRGEAVMNVFNLEDKAQEKEIRFRPADIGLPNGKVGIEVVPVAEQDGKPVVTMSVSKDGEVILKVSIPAKGHQLVKIKGV